VLGAIHVPSLDGEQDHALGTSLVALVEQRLEQGVIMLDCAGPAPNLDALPARDIDQKQEGAVVFREVSEGDVLPISPIVGESEGLLVQYLDETLWPAPMLDVGRAFGGRGAEECRVLLGNESRKLGRDRGGKACGSLLVIRAG